MSKITLKEFFELPELTVIHCNTKEKAIELLEAFDRLGKKWWNEISYLEFDNWNDYREDTCYSNKCGYCDVRFYHIHDVKIYEFEDVILEEDKTKEAEEVKTDEVRVFTLKISEDKFLEFCNEKEIIKFLLIENLGFRAHDLVNFVDENGKRFDFYPYNYFVIDNVAEKIEGYDEKFCILLLGLLKEI